MINLKKLRKIQEGIKGRVILEDGFSNLESIAGVDVAYPRGLEGQGIGACVVLDYSTGEVLEEQTASAKIDFPYIPRYLAFREFAAIKKVLSKVESKISVLMVDGNGVLHPHGMGIASHVGVLLDLPTIGVAKSLLCGEEGREVEKGVREILYKDKLVGYAVKSKGKAIYASPGHRVSFSSSLAITKRFLKFRIPEPLRMAHILASKF